MPDSTPPDWTPDEAFWDEAWKDMNDRLDRRRRRKLLLWALPLALLLVVGAGTLVVTSSGAATAAEAVAREQATAATVPRQPANSVRQDRPIDKNDNELLPPVGSTSTSSALATSVTQAATTTNSPVVQQSFSEELLPAAPPAMTTTVALVEVLPPQPLALHEPDLPLLRSRAISPVRERRKLFVEAGGSSFLPLPQLGVYAAVGYGLRVKRWEVPLILRYDGGRRTVYDELREEVPSPVLDYTLGSTFNSVQVPLF